MTVTFILFLRIVNDSNINWGLFGLGNQELTQLFKIWWIYFTGKEDHQASVTWSFQMC